MSRKKPPADEPQTSNVVAFPRSEGICAGDVTSGAICAGDVTKQTGKKPSKINNLPEVVSPFPVKGQGDMSPTRANALLSRSEFLKLLDTLSDMALRKRFPLEATTHRDMLRRRFKEYMGCAIAPEFEKFRSFLRHVGQRPSADWTLDRKDPYRMEYGPGLVRWADKREQANNRRCTIQLRNVDGETRPLTDWARLTDQNPNTMRVRLNRGWNHAEVIAGRRGIDIPEAVEPLPPPVRMADVWPEGTKSPAEWEAYFLEFRRRFPGSNASRPAFMVWLLSNASRHAHDRLRKRFPAFEEGYDDEPRGYAVDPDRQMVLKIEPRLRAAWQAMGDDADQHAEAAALIRRWPTVQTPQQAAALIIREDDDE